jgi:hypothetical protein
VKAYLRSGAMIDLGSDDCEGKGKAIEIEDLEPGTPQNARAAAVGGPGLSPAAAERRGLADVIDLPGSKVVVTRDDQPVSIRATGGKVVIRVRDTAGGPETVYGPIAGGAVVGTGPTGAAVTAGGKPIAPAAADTTPPRTSVSLKRLRGGRVLVTLRAADARISVQRKRGGRWTPYVRPFVVRRSALKSLRFRAFDALGNAERVRAVR